MSRLKFLNKKYTALAVFLLVGTLALIPIMPSMPVLSFEEVRARFTASETVLLDRYGKRLHITRTDYTGRRLSWIRLEDISPAMIDLIVLAEDKRFWSHGGVDALAILSSIVRAVSSFKRPHGASTLTMQLGGLLDQGLRARKTGRSFLQKIVQARTAWSLERGWTKKEILEAYLNLVTFRGELQGIQAASRALLDKWPSGLQKQESALLSVLVRAPNASPFEAGKRACQLLVRTGEADTCSEVQSLSETALTPPYLIEHIARDAPHVARHLGQDISSGSPIKSTIDRELQRFTKQSLKRHITSLKSRNVHDAAVLVADNMHGEILAYVASSGDLSPSWHVDGIRAQRQAGSTLKPFLYGLAIEKRLVTPSTLLDDAPVEINIAGGGVYRPQNYDNLFYGPVTVREALASSLNTPAVRTIINVGPQRFVNRLKSLGFKTLQHPDFYGASLALGSADVSLWNLVNAYRTLANGGLFSSLRLEPGSSSTARPVLDKNAAYMISNILADREARSRTFGFDSSLSTPFFSAVKTGTSKDMRDNWCVGFSQHYTVGVWVGNFSGKPMWNVSGISGAGPIWRDVISYLHRDLTSNPPRPPSGLVKRKIKIFPGGRVYNEWYLKGSEPPPGKTHRVKLKPEVALPYIEYPTDGALIALDPDIPAPLQRIRFKSSGDMGSYNLYLNQNLIGPVSKGYDWQPERGNFQLTLKDGSNKTIDIVSFKVR